jgi:hypothetical protein
MPAAAAPAARVGATTGLSPKDLALVPKLRKAGILMPVRCILAARKAGVPVSLAGAILLQESGGGANVFGHDPTIFTGAGEVTREKYAAYKQQRGTARMQGVGPCQLTWWELQDEADRRGGCWRPLVNMQVAFAHLASLVAAHGLHDGVRAYNGSGPAAEAYARSVLGRKAKIDAVLGQGG